MIVYPAIDLKDGICVRLMHGRFDAVTRYDDQPAARLTAFAAAGARLLRVWRSRRIRAIRNECHAFRGAIATQIRDEWSDRTRIVGKWMGFA